MLGYHIIALRVTYVARGLLAFQAREVADARLSVSALCRLRQFQRPPNAFRCRWHIDMRHTVRAQRIDDRVDQRRRAANRPRLARALHPQRIGRAGNLQQFHLDIRELVGMRQRVVHETARQQLPGLRIIDRVLQRTISGFTVLPKSSQTL